MSGLVEVNKHRAFVPEQFEVVSDFDDIVIDPRIAADVANAVFDRNNPGNPQNRNNNRMYSTETSFVVDTRWDGYSAWPGDIVDTDENTGEVTREPGYRIHVPHAGADASTDVVNRTFAWNLQRMLDAQEKDNRLGQIGSTVMLGFSSAIAAAPAAAPLIAAESSGTDISAATILAPAALGLKMLGPVVWGTIKHMGRNNIVKPETMANKVHMRNTIKHIGRLGLQPMLYEIVR